MILWCWMRRTRWRRWRRITLGLSVSESQVRYLLHSLFAEKTHRGFLATLDNLDTLAAITAVDEAERAANELFETARPMASK